MLHNSEKSSHDRLPSLGKLCIGHLNIDMEARNVSDDLSERDNNPKRVHDVGWGIGVVSISEVSLHILRIKYISRVLNLKPHYLAIPF